MYSNSYKSPRNKRKQKQLIIEDETPEQQEQREIRELMATLDEEQEIGILQMPVFHHHQQSSSSSRNSKTSKEHPKIVKPITSPRSPRRHSRRQDSSEDIIIPESPEQPESPEELEKRELKELLDQLEDEVEIGLLQAPSEFQRKVQPPTTEKKTNQRSENRSKVSSQIENAVKETPEETERREIKELIDQLSEEQEIGILDPSTENRIAGHRNDDLLENPTQNDNEKEKDAPSQSIENSQFEMLSEMDQEKLEIQKLFKELEDEQEEGLLEIPTGPRRYESSSHNNESETETEAEVSVQDTTLIDKEKEKSEEEDETLGLSENSVESADFATLKLPNEHDFEVEEALRRAEKEKLNKQIEQTSQSSRSQTVSNEETIESILDTNASDIDAEPVWHVFRDPTYSFKNEKYTDESNPERNGNVSRASQSTFSSRTGGRRKIKDDEEIAQELLISEDEKMTMLSDEFASDDTPLDDEEVANGLLQSEKDKELIDTTTTDKIVFQTSEERISKNLVLSENDKEYATSTSDEKTARELKSFENEKEFIGSTSTSKMTFQTSEERIAKGLLSSENEKDDFHHVIEPEERIANALLLSENEKIASMSSASSTDSLDKVGKAKLNRNESADTFTQDTLVDEDEKDKLSSTSASSISKQDSCNPDDIEDI